MVRGFQSRIARLEAKLVPRRRGRFVLLRRGDPEPQAEPGETLFIMRPRRPEKVGEPSPHDAPART